MTISEDLFERLCNGRKVQWKRLATRDQEGLRTPDYEIRLSGRKVIVEVKQIDPNDQDRRQPEVDWSDARFRIRIKIKSAAGQLRPIAKGQHPSIIVLFDNTDLRTLGSENILNAMYGEEVVDILVSREPNVAHRAIAHRFGGGRRLTESEGLYISAIGRLRVGSDGEGEMDLFHNRFATFPLSPRTASCIATRQYHLSEARPNQYCLWEEVSE